MPPPFVGKVLGFAPSCLHALGYFGADFNNRHAPVDLDGDLHRIVLRSDFWGLNGGGGERHRGWIVRLSENRKAPGGLKAIRVLVTTL
jgi:hypothetical protein